METNKLLIGKKVIIVDDEPDVLDALTEFLSMCMIDRASTFEEAKDLLETQYYDVAVFDIMGVKGFELLEIAKSRNPVHAVLLGVDLTEDLLGVDRHHNLGPSHHLVEVVAVDLEF